MIIPRSALGGNLRNRRSRPPGSSGVASILGSLHANIAFSTRYTKEERERLVDVYMAKFKEIFGTYPKSVGSWFIDAHTLGYMYDKYKIVASCNCKGPSGDGWLYPMGWLLEPSLLPKPDKRLYAGADRGGANPRSYFPYAGQ